VTVLKRGRKVATSLINGPGSGAQAVLPFKWKTGVTYGFLTVVNSLNISDSTIVSGWLYDPLSRHENDGWRLIAAFWVPQLQTYITGPYGFIQCTDPNFGNLTR